ncbi:unnamed protein product [Arabis nemorensis]|uniref:Uncharacterized protein n=1 Tax=Arabis nemorensis TaxID=586526 RepID=A0A565B5J0_9BRAS|nr:unnamed protein product [Arabis nemorensis]
MVFSRIWTIDIPFSSRWSRAGLLRVGDFDSRWSVLAIGVWIGGCFDCLLGHWKSDFCGKRLGRSSSLAVPELAGTGPVSQRSEGGRGFSPVCAMVRRVMVVAHRRSSHRRWAGTIPWAYELSLMGSRVASSGEELRGSRMRYFGCFNVSSGLGLLIDMMRSGLLVSWRMFISCGDDHGSILSALKVAVQFRPCGSVNGYETSSA